MLQDGGITDEGPITTENKVVEVPSLLQQAIKAFCETKDPSDQLVKRNADFLRAHIVKYLMSEKKLFGSKISLVRGSYITSLELDGSQLNSQGKNWTLEP